MQNTIHVLIKEAYANDEIVDGLIMFLLRIFIFVIFVQTVFNNLCYIFFLVNFS